MMVVVAIAAAMMLPLFRARPLARPAALSRARPYARTHARARSHARRPAGWPAGRCASVGGEAGAKTKMIMIILI